MIETILFILSGCYEIRKMNKHCPSSSPQANDRSRIDDATPLQCTDSLQSSSLPSSMFARVINAQAV